MRRIALFFVLVLVLAGLIVPPVAAAPSLQGQVLITSPGVNEEVRGLVPVIGSASVPGFQYYKLEYGVGPNPTDWALVDRMFDTAVINNQLAVWNTNAVPDGVYSLRLRAVKQDGNYDEFSLRGVIVSNTRPTSTTTVTPTETPGEQATPAPGATPVAPGTPAPTATPVTVVPAGPLAPPTATPTIGAPARQSNVPFDLDPKGWSQAFVFGVMAMGAAIAVLGIVFAVRRLL
jgi:hypothetical protein